MKTSERGRNDLVLSEGLRTKAYRDSVGVWTIGVGHTANAGGLVPHAGVVITREQAMQMFADDLGKYEKRVSAVLGTVPQNVFDGAVSFDYNTGGISKASWVKFYHAGQMGIARKAFMQWDKPSEIIGRRTREARLIFDGVYATKEGHSVPETVPTTIGPDRAAIVREAQALLDKLGFTPGAMDGLDGPMTKAATLAYQKTKDQLGDDGIIGPQTLASLRADVEALTRANDVPATKPSVPAPTGFWAWVWSLFGR